MAPGTALWLALAAGALAPQGRTGGAQGPLASGVVRAVEVAQPPGTLVLHFRLDRGAGDAALDAAGEPLGLLRYIAGPDPAQPASRGLRLECEARFFEEETQVVHDERLRHDEQILTWREVRERAGRTLVLRGSKTAGFTILEASVEGSDRRAAAGAAGELPLAVLEAARRAHPLPDELSLFEPLSGVFEPIHVRSRIGAGVDERVLELARADGTLLARVTFRGAEIVEWRFQVDGLVARPIPEDEYVRRLAERRARAAEEAAARAAEAAAVVPAVIGPRDLVVPRTRFAASTEVAVPRQR